MYLSDNYFNPAQGAVLGVDVLIDQGGEVKIMVYNIAGQEVEKLVDQTLSPGSFHFTWDGRNRSGDIVGNGVYFLLIEQPSGNFIRKVIVLK
jgi:flagellar hook assembly protein FlgD